MPHTHEGHRLSAALRPYGTPASATAADTTGSAGRATAAGAPVQAPDDSGQAQDDAAENEEDDEEVLEAGG
ncbi:hypothetical protein [Streptomyces sp. NPDC050263]|uniref:hypothetical protein n=1 Tax=Streptomyces sp. NPDC050263 TaxID=3155037 RepID=UPI0034175052